MATSTDYIRIGTGYHKLVKKPLASGDFAAILIPWSVDCIKQDHGKDYLSHIPKYDGFCIIPGHLDYRRIVGRFYNKYHPFLHKPKPGEPKRTLEYLLHIFGDQLELGLDYLKLLLEKPLQMLPILCLVSLERNTGKTTFLNWLKAVFGDNMTINTNEDFRSNFNAGWTNKVVIGVDETLLQHKEDSERLKNLSTASTYKSEAKGQEKEEIEFFGKFVLCSNNEDSFVMVDAGETRYWIRKIPVLQHDDQGLLATLKKEIPHFIHYLMNRELSTAKASRMWFTPAQIATPALKKLIRQSRNKLETEIAALLQVMADEKEVAEVKFCLGDVQDWLKQKGVRNNDVNSIRRILQNTWNLKPSANSNAYSRYKLAADGTIYESTAKGRYYLLDAKTIEKLNDP